MSLTSVLDGYLATAVATMDAPPVTAVIGAEPDVVNTPTIGYWYLGTKVGDTQSWAPNTLNRTQEVQGWRIRIYLPLGPTFAPSSPAYEVWVVTLVDAIRGQLYGHVGAGGAATGQGMELTDAIAGYLPMGKIWCRIVTMDWWAMLTDTHVIAV